MAALIASIPTTAQAQQTSVGAVPGPLFPQPGSGSLYPGGGSLYPNSIPRPDGIRHSRDFVRRTHGGFGTLILETEPQVVHDVIVVHDQPAVPVSPPPAPLPPREAYVIGRSYNSLPGGCMKMVQGGVSYYHCSGDWYREIGGRYKAVHTPL
jgi:hypothetical protein